MPLVMSVKAGGGGGTAGGGELGGGGLGDGGGVEDSATARSGAAIRKKARIIRWSIGVRSACCGAPRERSLRRSPRQERSLRRSVWGYDF